MNEKTTKHLLKKSKVTTSDTFTDALMEKIEAAPAPKTSKLPLGRIAKLVAVIALVISVTVYRSLYYWEGMAAISISKTPIFIAFTLVLLLAVNYVLRLQALQSSNAT